MIKNLATSTKTILPSPLTTAAPRSRPSAAPRARAGFAPAPSLAVRAATPADRPWIEAWAAQLQLPVPTARRVQTFLLLEDGQRIGHLAAREDVLPNGRAGEPVLWIISAFLVPAARGRGLMLRFGEMLSRDIYRKGRVGARIAADNARVHKLMAVGGWTVRRSTRRYVDYMLDLNAPFRAAKR